jgi:hypothetical protein
MGWWLGARSTGPTFPPPRQSLQEEVNVFFRYWSLLKSLYKWLFVSLECCFDCVDIILQNFKLCKVGRNLK